MSLRAACFRLRWLPRVLNKPYWIRTTSAPVPPLARGAPLFDDASMPRKRDLEEDEEDNLSDFIDDEDDPAPKKRKKASKPRSKDQTVASVDVDGWHVEPPGNMLWWCAPPLSYA